MRVTNTSMIRNTMYDTQYNLSRMNKLNEQISTGKVVNRVSDDPHKAVRIMTLNNEIKYTEKYNYNIDETVGWMNTTDSSLDKFGSLLGDIKEGILKMGNGTYSKDEFKAIYAEMNEKIKEIASTLNTTYGGKYMFGGTNVDEKPVIFQENPDGTVTLEINLNSNISDLKADISDGVNIDYNISAIEILGVSVNTDGKPNVGTKEDVYGNLDGNGFLNDINKISKLMNIIANGTNEEDIKAAQDSLQGTIKDNIDLLSSNALDNRTSLGVRVTTAEKIRELNEDNILNMKGVLSLDQDVDHVEKFIELKSAEMVYQASIQVGAKLIQPTIMDYLR